MATRKPIMAALGKCVFFIHASLIKLFNACASNSIADQTDFITPDQTLHLSKKKLDVFVPPQGGKLTGMMGLLGAQLHSGSQHTITSNPLDRDSSCTGFGQKKNLKDMLHGVH